MRLTIVYDNEVFEENPNLKSDWGFSCFIEGKENILFDTGTKGDILISNMKALNVDPREIDKIVISHEHFDHNGGLGEILKHTKDVEIYRIKGSIPGVKVIEVGEDKVELADGIWSTGKLGGLFIKEQSLVLEGKEGWYVLVGCSHPGVDKILERAKDIGDVVGIIGGFHGFKKLEVFKELKFICPCHCTSLKREILERFPDKSSRCGVGKVIEI